jgi:serine/threonine-protein kinase RsbW
MTDHGDDAGSGLRTDRRRHELMLAELATPSALRTMRRRVRHWLDELDWPAEDAEDVELAVSEAVSNVIEHAYPPTDPGMVTLHAWVATHPGTLQRRIGLAVVDRGRWAAYHPGDVPRQARGHGLTVMSGCMAELHIERGVAGTTVMMISASVPPSG